MRSQIDMNSAELATLMKFEALLRTALSKTGFLFFSGEAFCSKQLLHCVRDLVWALTRAIPGGNYKVVHAIHLAGFPIPWPGSAFLSTARIGCRMEPSSFVESSSRRPL